MGLGRTNYEDVVKLQLECDVRGCERETVLRIPKNPRGDGAPVDIEWKIITKKSGGEEEVFATCPIHQ